MTGSTSSAPRTGRSASRWLDARLDSFVFRLRLLRMAVRRLENLPPGVVMALEAPDYDAAWLYEPERAQSAVSETAV
jgi:hypothetical protein